MNIIEALIKVGYSVSTEMQKKENYKNKNGLQASDVSKMMEFKSNFLINKSYVSQRKEEAKENVIYLRLYRREYSKSPHGKQKRYISPSRIKRREKNSSLNYPRNRSNSKIPSMKYKQKVDSIYGTEKFMLPKIRSPKGSPYVRNIFSERSKVGASFKSSDLRGGITNIDEETFRSLKELHEIKMRNLRRVSNNGSSVFSNHEYTRSRAFSGVRESTSSEIVSATVELLSQKPSSIGASSNQGYSNSITTKDRSIRLNMPSHKYAVPLPQKRFADNFSRSMKETTDKDFINRNKIVIHNLIKKRKKQQLGVSNIY
eukprot:CAMPEP_0196998156 /NCGR_PEP_ID=MMETSP1380-20130617/3600_1 /TAXON_ID=5936 /ORGANISM="Euplotes crassus, Strain CT5" /LENGTH=314 /DNA_ID=CAMNT_0042414619 /DNA_START=500 /DNA_END=1444 /DNA_ORIENTATION=+